MRIPTKKETNLSLKKCRYIANETLELSFEPKDSTLKEKISLIIYFVSKEKKVRDVLIFPINGNPIDLDKKGESNELKHAENILKVVLEKEKLRLLSFGIDYKSVLK